MCRVTAPWGAVMKYAHQAATRLPPPLNPAPQDSLFTFSPQTFSSSIVFALQARLEATPVAQTAGILFVFFKKLNVFLSSGRERVCSTQSPVFPRRPSRWQRANTCLFRHILRCHSEALSGASAPKGRREKNLLPCVDQLARSHIHA